MLWIIAPCSPRSCPWLRPIRTVWRACGRGRNADPRQCPPAPHRATAHPPAHRPAWTCQIFAASAGGGRPAPPPFQGNSAPSHPWGSARLPAFEFPLRIGRHDTIGGSCDRFAEIGSPLRGFAVVCQRIAIGAHSIVEAAEFGEHRRQHGPATAVGRIFLEVRLGPAPQDYRAVATPSGARTRSVERKIGGSSGDPSGR